MRKIVTLFAVLTFVRLFSQSWYDSNGFAEVIKPLTDSKNSEWKGYSFSFYNAFNIISERAVYFDVNDFGLDYPVTLQAVRTYLYEDNYSFNYKIYAKDGITVLFQSQSNSVYGLNQCNLSTAIVLSDDFWVAIVPYEAGHPFQLNSDEVVETHSYSGSAGSWTQFKYEDKEYEHLIHALLSPYEGEDTYPPDIVSVSGAEFYMNMDAEITLTVSDQSQVISPIIGEYSFDGGTVWESFELFSNKNRFTFSGTIPGQPDGTTGKIRFNPVDNLGYSKLSDEYSVSWSKSFKYFEEDFEGDPLGAEGWTLQTSGAGWIQSGYSYAHTGIYSMAHLDDMGAQDDWLISPVITLPSDISLVASFWEMSNFVEYIGNHEVCVTTDGGDTWSSIISTIPEARTFNQVSFSLDDYKGQNIQLGWHYTGDYSDQWYIDDVELFIDDESPEIIQITADSSVLPIIGAFINKNMVISLSIFDNTNIKSALGHYSFDGGSTITDVVLNKNTVSTLWECTIPSKSYASEGTINFDITDIAGNLLHSENFTIKFVSDIWEPVIESLVGTTVQLNNDAKVHLALYDHSSIASCLGFYSKDGFLTQYEFEMTKDSKNVYDFFGTIPAETELTIGEVKFIVEDSEGNILNTEKYKVEWIDTLPDKFDLRTSLGTNYVTSVKDQYYGTCWAHAAVATIESNLLKTGNWESSGETGEPDLSEQHLSLWCGFNKFFNGDIDPPTDDGLEVHMRGDYLMTAAYLSRGEGAIRNIDAQYWSVNSDRFSENYHYFYAREIEWYMMDYDLNGIDLIKQKIIEHGAIGTSLVHTFVNADFNHYQPPSDPIYITHAVSIVGWDDNHITQAPEGKGAWLCKNSYGAEWGYAGYFWASYFTKHVGKDPEGGAISFQNVEKMKYDNVYYHDYHGWSDSMADISEAFNVFTAQKNEYLKAVNFFTAKDNVDYTVSIYDDFNGSELQNLLSTVSGHIDHIGLHTVDLPNEVLLSGSNDFYIYLYLSQGGQPYDQSSVIPSANLAYQSSANQGESFYKTEGQWVDLYNNTSIAHPRTANFCIKGLSIDSSGIDEDENSIKGFKLYQNYPNPFNPETTIKYSIASESQVELNIYNINGQLVKNLVNRKHEPGLFNVEFKADDLTTGLYFYKLKVDGKNIQSRKMMLIK